MKRLILNNTVKALKKENRSVKIIIDEIQSYEPSEDNALYQGLKSNFENEKNQNENLRSQLNQLKRSEFTENEIKKSISNLEKNLENTEKRISEF